MTDTVDRTESTGSGGSGLDSYFKLSQRGSSVGTEIRAGVTTFLVMAYIIFVNPAILSAAGFDAPAVAAGTALVAGLLCILMGVVANYPIAMAAGLGINGAVAFGLVLGQGLTPAGAMGVIVLEGLIVLALVVEAAPDPPDQRDPTPDVDGRAQLEQLEGFAATTQPPDRVGRDAGASNVGECPVRGDRQLGNAPFRIRAVASNVV